MDGEGDSKMRKTLPFLATAALVLTPLFAQSTTTQQNPPATSTAPMAGHGRGTMEHPTATNNDTQSQAASARQEQTGTTTRSTTKATRTTTARGTTTRRTTASRTARVSDDATRLAALLHDLDAHPNVTISETMWRTIANEANTLANRIYANTSGATRTTATELRRHVRSMHTSALRGDAAEARRHAALALPVAHRLGS
jgi:hypothetical protein